MNILTRRVLLFLIFTEEINAALQQYNVVIKRMSRDTDAYSALERTMVRYRD